MQCTHGRWFSTPKKNAGRLSHREEKTIILVETKGSPPSTTMTYYLITVGARAGHEVCCFLMYKMRTLNLMI